MRIVVLPKRPSHVTAKSLNCDIAPLQQSNPEPENNGCIASCYPLAHRRWPICSGSPPSSLPTLQWLALLVASPTGLVPTSSQP